jgi:hypothetical protein
LEYRPVSTALFKKDESEAKVPQQMILTHENKSGTSMQVRHAIDA